MEGPSKDRGLSPAQDGQTASRSRRARPVLRRDKRTVVMMLLFPFMFLIIFGYAASFDVKEVRTIVVGPLATQASTALPDALEVIDVRPGDDGVTVHSPGLC